MPDDLAGVAPSPLRPVPFRGGGFRPQTNSLVSLAVFIALILVWQAGSMAGIISPIALPAPSEVIAALIDSARTGVLWRDISVSLLRVGVGWVAGTIIGIAVGFMIGLFTLARAALMQLTSALFAVPKIAMLPLFIVWFGIGESSKIMTILFGTFFPTVIATYAGVDNVDRGLIRMGQSFGLSWASIVWKIILPGALPAILSGLRISAAIAIVLLIAAEMIGAQYGIGAYILQAGSLFAIDQLIGGVTILAIMGLVVSWVIGRAEKHFLDWRS